MKDTQFIAGIAIRARRACTGLRRRGRRHALQGRRRHKVDKMTLEGWRTWRALACERCHGARQEGLVGPPLIES